MFVQYMTVDNSTAYFNNNYRKSVTFVYIDSNPQYFSQTCLLSASIFGNTHSSEVGMKPKTQQLPFGSEFPPGSRDFINNSIRLFPLGYSVFSNGNGKYAI